MNQCSGLLGVNLIFDKKIYTPSFNRNLLGSIVDIMWNMKLGKKDNQIIVETVCTFDTFFGRNKHIGMMYHALK